MYNYGTKHRELSICMPLQLIIYMYMYYLYLKIMFDFALKNYYFLCKIIRTCIITCSEVPHCKKLFHSTMCVHFENFKVIQN